MEKGDEEGEGRVVRNVWRSTALKSTSNKYMYHFNDTFTLHINGTLTHNTRTKQSVYPPTATYYANSCPIA